MSRAEPSLIDRRLLLRGAGVLGGLNLVGLGGCITPTSARSGAAVVPAARPTPTIPMARLRVSEDRLFDVTVCLRPFRAAGPRLETEQVGDTFVVHNYGHGGIGWSLSWGSGAQAVRMAMASSPAEIAVVGCGALGLTAATLARRAGAKVTIYAKEYLPETRSSRATGSWTPDSRIALSGQTPPGFAERWEEMARFSFKTYRSYLGLPGTPVEWVDRYLVPGGDHNTVGPAGGLDFAGYSGLISDITPKSELVPAGATPLTMQPMRRFSQMRFNIADYGHTLMDDFLLAGGHIVRRTFNAPAEIAALPQKVVINCTGYGARALWKDESLEPVRGQIAWLIPQPEVNYGLFYRDVYVLPRSDGIVVQAVEGGDLKGYNDDHEVVDRGEAERAVGVIEELYSRVRR